jgi:hypothetical protein
VDAIQPEISPQKKFEAFLGTLKASGNLSDDELANVYSYAKRYGYQRLWDGFKDNAATIAATRSMNPTTWREECERLHALSCARSDDFNLADTLYKLAMRFVVANPNFPKS